jgi:hypothetical protein
VRLAVPASAQWAGAGPRLRGERQRSRARLDVQQALAVRLDGARRPCTSRAHDDENRREVMRAGETHKPRSIQVSAIVAGAGLVPLRSPAYRSSHHRTNASSRPVPDGGSAATAGRAHLVHVHTRLRFAPHVSPFPVAGVTAQRPVRLGTPTSSPATCVSRRGRSATRAFLGPRDQ